MEEKPHHRTGTKWDLKTKAKISTSKIIKKDKDPVLHERLFQATLRRMKIIQKIHGKPT